MTNPSSGRGKLLQGQGILLGVFVALSALWLAMSLCPPGFDAVAGKRSARVVDMTGNSVAIALPVERIVLLTPMVGAYATLSGGTGDLAAVSEYGKYTAENSFIARIFPDTASLHALKLPDGRLDPEVFFGLRAGAILSFPYQASTLRSFGLPGISMSFSTPTFMQDGWRGVRLMGDLSGRSASAEALITESQAQTNQILHQIAATRGTAPRVIVLMGHDGDLFVPRTHYLKGWLVPLGADYAGRGALSGKADLERLLALDPDVIFLDDVPDDPEAVTPATLFGAPQYALLRAVRNHRVYKTPTAYLSTQGVDDALLLRWFAEVLYPDRMDRGLRTLMRETYQKIYAYNLAESELDRALLMKENGASAGYARFGR